MIQNTNSRNDTSAPLYGKRILLLLENRFEDLELWYPKIRLIEAGCEVVVAAPDIQEYKGNYGLPATPDVTFSEIRNMKEFDGIIVPGGFAPDMLRRDPAVLSWVKECTDEGKLVAFICHAAWVPISAKIIKGRRATGVVAVRDDLLNAGALWEDAAVVRDENLISSRTPADLAYFCHEIITFLRNK